jgi:hypothetical protein
MIVLATLLRPCAAASFSAQQRHFHSAISPQLMMPATPVSLLLLTPFTSADASQIAAFDIALAITPAAISPPYFDFHDAAA